MTATVRIHCRECGHKLFGFQCPRCGYEASIEEQTAMMKQRRGLAYTQSQTEDMERESELEIEAELGVEPDSPTKIIRTCLDDERDLDTENKA